MIKSEFWFSEMVPIYYYYTFVPIYMCDGLYIMFKFEHVLCLE